MGTWLRIGCDGRKECGKGQEKDDDEVFRTYSNERRKSHHRRGRKVGE